MKFVRPLSIVGIQFLVAVDSFSATRIGKHVRGTITRCSPDLKLFSSESSEPAKDRRRCLSILITSCAALGTVSTQWTLSNAPAVAVDVDDFKIGGKIVYGDESIMSPKQHGTSANPVQEDLLFGVSTKLADRICNYNRHFAEMSGYFQNTDFNDTVMQAKKPITFYDSVTGKPLFVAPIGRTAEEFLNESQIHGWPSFRDSEVVWENVRVLRQGETVSIDGTHLGHNLPDRNGNRYCINLVSIAGHPNRV